MKRRTTDQDNAHHNNLDLGVFPFFPFSASVDTDLLTALSQHLNGVWGSSSGLLLVMVIMIPGTYTSRYSPT
jgi:hypothetical protein